MSDKLDLVAEYREDLGKGASRRLRRNATLGVHNQNLAKCRHCSLAGAKVYRYQIIIILNIPTLEIDTVNLH